MKAVSYHSFIDTLHNNTLNACNVASEEYPLMVNCAGVFSNARRFNTDNHGGREDYYLMYVVSGRIDVLSGESFTECTQGSLIIFPPRKRYAYRHTEDGNAEYFFVHFTGSDAERVLADCSLKMHPAVNLINHSETLIPRFQNMLDAFANHDRLRSREVAALFHQVLIHLSRRMRTESDGSCRSLYKSVGRILSGYAEDIKIPELAELENLSLSRYNALFRKNMGCSPVEFITETRMTAACELILITDMSIKEIGQTCGYPDPHFFSKVFKKRFGVSPTEYRSGKR